MRATSGFVRLFIRGLAWDAAEVGSTFADALKSAARARLTETSKGKTLVGTGQGGASVSFSLPPLGDLTGQDVAEVCSRVLDKADILVAATPDITDAALVTALLAEFPAIRSMRSDFSGLRR